ncbi:OLC1v1025963C1 [Oldenlandia corymbosa var. corymbosa]|uniref:OLC1v1025963C1 n=1 Tax=Oldenlandia corymbosa var. corymbosa TaxID=529605 RepID=A0AAV1C8U2_OLDCO|nr:OLC1v1025963C1 [Oldenlandia corymbosa var. corymbosa]
MARMILGIPICLSFLILANSLTFDITKYGAKSGGGDISQALLNAWNDACSSVKPSTILIPAGTFTLKEAYLKGPCKAPLALTVHGTVKAQPNPKSVKKENE